MTLQLLMYAETLENDRARRRLFAYQERLQQQAPTEERRHDAGSGLPADPRTGELGDTEEAGGPAAPSLRPGDTRAYFVPRSQVWAGSRGRAEGRVHVIRDGKVLCGRKRGWYERPPLDGEPDCQRCTARLERE
jgi:hypothetical protein